MATNENSIVKQKKNIKNRNKQFPLTAQLSSKPKEKKNRKTEKQNNL